MDPVFVPLFITAAAGLGLYRARSKAAGPPEVKADREPEPAPQPQPEPQPPPPPPPPSPPAIRRGGPPPSNMVDIFGTGVRDYYADLKHVPFDSKDAFVSWDDPPLTRATEKEDVFPIAWISSDMNEGAFIDPAGSVVRVRDVSTYTPKAQAGKVAGMGNYVSHVGATGLPVAASRVVSTASAPRAILPSETTWQHMLAAMQGGRSEPVVRALYAQYVILAAREGGVPRPRPTYQAPPRHVVKHLGRAGTHAAPAPALRVGLTTGDWNRIRPPYAYNPSGPTGAISEAQIETGSRVVFKGQPVEILSEVAFNQTRNGVTTQVTMFFVRYRGASLFVDTHDGSYKQANDTFDGWLDSKWVHEGA